MALTPSFLRPPCKTRSRAPLQHFPSLTTTPFELVWVDAATRWPVVGRTIFPAAKAKTSRGKSVASYLPRRSSGSIWPRLSRELRYMERVSASKVTRALSRASSSLRPLMETRPCLVLHVTEGVRSFSVSSSLSFVPPRCHPRRRPRSNLDPIAGSTTISIPPVTKPAIYGGDLLPYL